jgi:hypothetical protein
MTSSPGRPVDRRRRPRRRRKVDAVVPSYANGTWSRMDSAVYYGGTPGRRTDRGAASWSKPLSSEGLAAHRAASRPPSPTSTGRPPPISSSPSAGFWEYRAARPSPASRIYPGRVDGFSRDRYTDIGQRAPPMSPPPT